MFVPLRVFVDRPMPFVTRVRLLVAAVRLAGPGRWPHPWDALVLLVRGRHGPLSACPVKVAP